MKENETPLTEEVDEEKEMDQFDLAKENLDMGFELIRGALESVGQNAEVERMWKGLSPTTGTLWLIEEMIEAAKTCVDVAKFGENTDYDRQVAQTEFSDALNDATGLIELMFGAFGSDRLNEFADHYVNEQEVRNRAPMWWYGAVRRRVGSQAYGAHLANNPKQSSPKVRQAIGRQVLHAKAAKKGWNTCTLPKPKLYVGMVADIETVSGKKKGYRTNITIAMTNAGSYDINEIVDNVGKAVFDEKLVYAKDGVNAKDGKMIAKALKGKTLDKVVAFKGALKAALRGMDLNTVAHIQMSCKVANLKADGRPEKVPAKNWDVEIKTKGENNGQ